MKILECVPNISEGRDAEIIEAIAQSIRSVKNVKLLHVDSGYAANRTVFTFVGTPASIEEAAFKLYQKCYELIDMSIQKGAHPRQGAVDVCPIVPLRDTPMETAIATAQRLAERISSSLNIPGYLYENSARSAERRNLAVLRKGQYESLPGKFKTLPPDFGSAANWKRNGVTVLGARKLLIAYNVNLNTTDADVARQIAENVRESGKVITNVRGKKSRLKGRLKSVKGLGWFIEDFNLAQVSYNLTDLSIAGMLDVFLATVEEAQDLGFRVTGSELIGLAPLSEFIKAGKYFAPQMLDEEGLIKAAVAGLNLNDLGSFNERDKIIERLVGNF